MNPNINIGFDSLRDSTKARAEAYKANEPHHQIHHKTKLEQTAPQGKATQGTSHISEIDRAFYIIGEEGGVDIGNKENRDALRTAQNYFKRAGDATMDLDIEKKIREGQKLTMEEEEREQKIAKNLQKHQNEFTPEVYNAFEQHFKKEKTLDHHTTWDARYDVKKMKEDRK